MSARWFAGIDGGQSSTVAVVGNDRGAVAGRGTAGPADEVAQSPDSTRLRDALEAALRAACDAAGVPRDAAFDTIVAGVSGYEGRVRGAPPTLPANRFELLHDAPIAHAGALAGEDGVTAIAGTGSVVYSTSGGAARTRGGWGYLFGDEGSAFWLARETLAELMRAADVRATGADAADGDARDACAFFGAASLRTLARAFYSGDIRRDRIAAFAVPALATSKGSAIAHRGARRLAELIVAAVRDGAPPRVALAGGLFLDGDFRRTVTDAVRERLPGADVRSAAFEPAEGALLLAYRTAGRRFAGDRR